MGKGVTPTAKQGSITVIIRELIHRLILNLPICRQLK
jgi:hypothetical protein